MLYYFQIGQSYTRRDVYKVIGIPEDTKGGNWDTGYNRYKSDWFIFCNIGVPGRTGHNYNNTLLGDVLIWYGKTRARLLHPSIQAMIDHSNHVYIFAREDNNRPFIYLGIGKVKSIEDIIPVKITWQFTEDQEVRSNGIAEEAIGAEKYIEGATKQISINIYERNLVARQKCLEYYGYSCSVCTFNFNDFYGEIGEGFMHVHHLKPLAEVNGEYHINPIQDLIPVCPNCHAMLHKTNPPLSISELQNIINKSQ